MAATVQSQATTAFAASTSVTITKPTGLTVGDLMVAHIAILADTDTISDATGWTHEVNNANAGTTKHSIFWKVADSSDVAASNFSFGASGNSIIGGAILRIDGYVSTDLLNDANNTAANTSTPSYTNTVTPSVADSLLLFFIVANETGAASNYAIATDNPTWTELYDFNQANGLMACASALRPETTATGDSSATVSSGSTVDSNGIMVAIGSVANISVTGTTGVINLVGNEGVSAAGANVSGATGVINLSGNEGTVATPTPMWTNQDKSSSSWTNQSKS